jgi:2-oxoglutarate ferredoxin oxidoreductase subunit beta
VARTIDMDREHSTKVLAEAHAHRGSAFVEIYQNCNVFNDKAFIQLTGRQERDANRIYLEAGKPVVFGANEEHGIIVGPRGATIVDVADVGLDAVHVHDPAEPEPGVAFALSRLAHGPYGPTPIGVFRSVERPTYADQLQRQLVDAQAKKGPGDLSALLRSAGTWTVDA